MKIILSLVSLVVCSTALDIDYQRLAQPREMLRQLWSMGKDREKKPDQDVCFDKWRAEGIYALRVSPPTHQAGESALILLGFDKVYDQKQEKFWLSAYPLSGPELTPDSAFTERDAYRGPLQIIGHKDHIYIIKEEREDWETTESSEDRNLASCKKVRMPFKKMEPLKKAKYLGLDFEHNVLCNHYADIHQTQPKQHGKWKCDIEHSEMHIDAFEHTPVDIHMEGKIKRTQGGRAEEERRVIVHVFFKDFEFEVSRKEEKQFLTVPPNIEELCSMEEEVSIEDLSDFESLILDTI